MLFGDQVIRLLRESWANAKMLAEELYTMFTTEAPLQVDQPLEVVPPSGNTQSPLTLGNYAPGDSLINVKGRQGDKFGDIVIGDDGSLQFVPQGQSGPTVKIGGGGIPGIIQGGTGSSYVVTIYPAGLSGASITVNVTQLLIDPSQSIPAGTPVLVVQTSDGSYYMQAPVWM